MAVSWFIHVKIPTIVANMFRSMAVSSFIHLKILYHIRICGLFGARSSVEITIKFEKKTQKEKPLSCLDKFPAAPLYKFSAFGEYK